MLQDVKVIPMSPQKGKARENKTWQTGWWDYQPLTDQFSRPLEWSQSSIIFCAHPVQPLIIARHFSSSKQFVISPPQIVSTSTSYGPPTLISAAPDDSYLFAHFPGRGADGIGVLWTRGSQIDNWSIKDSWPIALGAAPVAATWLGQPREWIAGDTPGSTMRLPPYGPRLALPGSVLMFVTQDHNVGVCYFRPYVSAIKIITCSITQPSVANEMMPREPTVTGTRQCFRASIGMGYQEGSVLIATRSRYLPLPLSTTSQYTTTDSSLQGGVKPSYPLELASLDWEPLGEEEVINSTPPQNQNWWCILSPRYQAQIRFPTGYGPYLSCVAGPFSNRMLQRIQKTGSRCFDAQVATFVLPTPLQLYLEQRLIFVGILDTSGPFSPVQGKHRKVQIGSTRVLNVVDLKDHADCEASPILCDVARLGRQMPLKAIMSPNGALLSTSSSSLWPLRTSIQLLPTVRMTPERRLLSLAPSLASALISGRVANDVWHILSLPSTNLEDVVDTLYQADIILDDQLTGFSHASTHGILGTALAIYRKRAMSIKSSGRTQTSRWKTAQNLCSLIAYNQAFDECMEGDIYDLDAVWPLIALMSWIVSLTEDILKHCVMLCTMEDTLANGDDEDVPMSQPYTPHLDTPILLFLAHPFALDQFVRALSHVQKFCVYVKSLTARGEAAQIARDTVIDLISTSGIDVSALVGTLEITCRSVQAFDREICRRVLVSCQPTPHMHEVLTTTIQNVTKSSIMTKATLFIKPHDWADGSGSAPITPSKDKDIITQRPLGSIATIAILATDHPADGPFDMPKVSLMSLPVSGLFGLVKPSGPTSMSVINDVKNLIAQSRLFVAEDKLEKSKGQKPTRKHRGNVKIGQGGTLDPLADGVLGCETDTYDSEGSRVRTAPWQHVTREKVEAALDQFSGEIRQTPPIFSALKMDGRPLYEYAREGIPLPRPIESRKVTVHSLELVEWLGTNHSYRWPEKVFSEKEQEAMEIALKGSESNASIKNDLDPATVADIPTAFVLKMKVSGGTYVRSIVHDLAHSLGSAGHVVTLSRSQQGRFALEPTEAGDMTCVPWEVFQRAFIDVGGVDEEGWTEWEREVIDKLDVLGKNDAHPFALPMAVNGINGASPVYRPLKPGIYAPIPSFFLPTSEDLDITTFEAHVARVAGANVAPVICGSMGEAIHLSHDERTTLIHAGRKALDQAGYKTIPIIAGTGAGSTRETIQLGIEAAEAGADYAIVICSGYFAGALTRPALKAFFVEVAEKCPIPVIIYNYPGASGGIDLDSDLIVELAEECPNIIGVKLTCGNVGKLTRISETVSSSSWATKYPRKNRHANFLVLGGFADFLIPSAFVDGHGAITGLANVSPYAISKAFELSEASRKDLSSLSEAQRLQGVIARADYTIAKTSIAGTKSLLEKLYGYGGAPRKPLPPIDSAAAEAIWTHPHTQELIKLERQLSGKSV
ncbi:hypothetical protein H0H93_011907 [Arthromyces matolae]|nr:hypothetical protein H0H93_011907 [Arthromyces matolae]